MSELALLVEIEDRPGMLAALSRVIFEHGGNVGYVDIGSREAGAARVFFEVDGVADADDLVAALRGLDAVNDVHREPTFRKVFGKRIIVIGGGAQVGTVAMGAVSEADRHNIRGEKISVDTIPLVGEETIAEAVRAAGWLPRVEAVVLAGSLMGGDITRAVREIQARGILVISLSMPGSVMDVADLVVTDPQQAGIMAVMLVASTASLDIGRIRGRRY